MAYYSVNISSDLAGQPAGNIRINFSPPLDFTRGEFQCACVQASMWNTYYNVSASSFNNSSFSFFSGTGTYAATIPDGVYDASLLIQAVYDAVAALTSTAVADNIIIAIATAQLGFSLFLAGGCTIDFSAGGSKMYVLFGAAPISYTTQDTLIIFPNQPNISSSTNVLTVRAPGLVASNTLNGVGSNILFAMAPDKPPGNQLVYAPATPIWAQVSPGMLNSLTLQVCDQLGRIIDFNNGADYSNNGSSFTIVFKELR